MYHMCRVYKSACVLHIGCLKSHTRAAAMGRKLAAFLQSTAHTHTSLENVLKPSQPQHLLPLTAATGIRRMSHICLTGCQRKNLFPASCCVPPHEQTPLQRSPFCSGSELRDCNASHVEMYSIFTQLSQKCWLGAGY